MVIVVSSAGLVSSIALVDLVVHFASVVTSVSSAGSAPSVV